jgi:hypothetical protein
LPFVKYQSTQDMLSPVAWSQAEGANSDVKQLN